MDADRFILRDEQGRVGGGSGTTRSSIDFHKVFMSKIRLNGQGIAKNYVGSLLKGRVPATGVGGLR